MPFAIEPHEKYIHIHCRGEMTLDELRQIDQQMNRILDAAPRKLHFVVDIEELTSAPMTTLIQRQYVSYTAHPNLGESITYGSHNRVVPVIVNSIKKMVNFRYTFVKDEAAAMAYLATLD